MKTAPAAMIGLCLAGVEPDYTTGFSSPVGHWERRVIESSQTTVEMDAAARAFVRRHQLGDLLRTALRLASQRLQASSFRAEVTRAAEDDAEWLSVTADTSLAPDPAFDAYLSYTEDWALASSPGDASHRVVLDYNCIDAD